MNEVFILLRSFHLDHQIKNPIIKSRMDLKIKIIIIIPNPCDAELTFTACNEPPGGIIYCFGCKI